MEVGPAAEICPICSRSITRDECQCGDSDEPPSADDKPPSTKMADISIFGRGYSINCATAELCRRRFVGGPRLALLAMF